MKKILVTAPPRTGKSTLISKIVKKLDNYKIAGFYTEEIRESDERIGFKIKTLDGVEGILASIYVESDLKISRYNVDLETFEAICIPCLEKALKDADIIVIDEIGPMQIFSERFKNLLLDIVKSNKTVLASIFLSSYEWIDDYKKNKEFEIIEINAENRDELVDEIAKTLISGN